MTIYKIMGYWWESNRTAAYKKERKNREGDQEDLDIWDRVYSHDKPKGRT